MEELDIQIRVIKEHNDIPEGSTIYVTKELKNHYKGIFASMAGSYIVKVKKKFCQIKDK